MRRGGWLVAGVLVLGAVLGPRTVAAAGDGAPRLLVMELQPGGEIAPDLARTLTDLITFRLSQRGDLEVVAGHEITQAVALEGEKQKLGCTEDSCLAELAAALDARFVVFGRVSTLGELRVVQLRLFDARSAQFLERVTVEGRSDEELSAALPAVLERLVAPAVGSAPSRAAAVASTAAADEASGGPPVLLFAGVGALGVGALAALATAAGVYHFNSVVADPAGTDKSSARASGLAVLLGGGLASIALFTSGVLLTGFGLVE